MGGSEISIRPDESRELLQFVRQVADDFLAGREAGTPPACAERITATGAFVTFRNHDRLRGCMGRFNCAPPIGRALLDVTQSSLCDPRFVTDPITLAELPTLSIELSLIGPLVEVQQPELLVAGRHGVVICREGRSGCFLPQVAVEQHWDIEKFLSECCRLKAGLPSDAWRDPATRIAAFETVALSERKPAGSPSQPA